MSKQHTPGPWEVYAHPIADAEAAKRELCEQVAATEELAGHLYLINANGKCPALTGCGPTSEVNARLIAAAPELLEACLAYAKAYDETTGTIHVNPKVRAAIAKATVA